jgi:hypothetical protein
MDRCRVSAMVVGACIILAAASAHACEMQGAGDYAQRLANCARQQFEEFGTERRRSGKLHAQLSRYVQDLRGQFQVTDLPEIPDSKIDTYHWSAIFVSWCVRTAGAEKGEFRAGVSHSGYLLFAMENSRRGMGVFRARPVETSAPKIGDIVVRNRTEQLTYDQAAKRKFFFSHGAIVVDIIELAGARYAVTIVGNKEAESGKDLGIFGREEFRLTTAGTIEQPRSRPFIAIIETLTVNGDVTPAAMRCGSCALRVTRPRRSASRSA